ncbi:MAG: 2-dehydropantoate 2-reductase N-terminal domain-containing protein [Ilumatobacteraceae bacterium]
MDACPIATIAGEIASTSETMRQAAHEAFESWLRAIERQLVAAGVDARRGREIAVELFCAIEGALLLARTSHNAEPIRTVGRAAARTVREALDRHAVNARIECGDHHHVALPPMQVTVLGAGSWGTTVANLVCNRNDTMLWARRAETADEINDNRTNETYLSGFELAKGVVATSDLEQALRHAELLIVGVPTAGVRDTMKEAKRWVHPWIPIVSLSKGLEQKSLLRMTEVIADELPGHPVAALTGPNIAREIMAGQAAASVIATNDLSVAAAIQG